MSDLTRPKQKPDKRQKWDKRYAARHEAQAAAGVLGDALVWSADPNALFVEQVAGLQPARALDVACGEGRNAMWLAAQGWQVTAIDFSAVAIEKARQIAQRSKESWAASGGSVDWVVDDVSSMVLEPQSFDLVAVLFLHTDPAERARWLDNVLAALKPGGTLIYVGHDPSNIELGIGGPQDPQLLPGAPELEEWLAEACGDFEIEFAGVVERRVDSDSGHVPPAAMEGSEHETTAALDTLVRARKR